MSEQLSIATEPSTVESTPRKKTMFEAANRAMAGPLEDILAKPCPLLAQILRELNALPGRIQRAIKALHAEKARRPISPNKRTKI